MSPRNPLNWLWLWQPVGFVLFFTAAIAETKRAPFDIPEGEPEIIGYFVEYSGMRWGMFFLAEFIEIVFSSAIMTRCSSAAGTGSRRSTASLARPRTCRTSLVVLLQFVRSGHQGRHASAWFQLMIRWTLPRFRADQLMSLGWKLLLPLSLANIMVTALIILWAQSR